MSSHALPHDDDDDEEVQLTDSRDVFDAVGARIAEAEESGRVVELDSDGDPSDDDIPLCVWQKREEDKRRFFSRLPLREIQKCLEFLQFDLVDTAMRSVSKATRAAARLALTCGRWRPIRYVAEQGLAVCRSVHQLRHGRVDDFRKCEPPAAARLRFQEAWALDAALVIRVVCGWEVGHPSHLSLECAIFLWIVEPSLDGLSRIVAACEDAYLLQYAGSYAYAPRDRFPWPMIRDWQNEIRGAWQCQISLEESWPLIGAGLEAWADQQLAATFTRECLDFSIVLYFEDVRILDTTARTWSENWEDRTKAGAFVAAMGRIREAFSRQLADEERQRRREEWLRFGPGLTPPADADY